MATRTPQPPIGRGAVVTLEVVGSRSKAHRVGTRRLKVTPLVNGMVDDGCKLAVRLSEAYRAIERGDARKCMRKMAAAQKLLVTIAAKSSVAVAGCSRLARPQSARRRRITLPQGQVLALLASAAG